MRNPSLFGTKREAKHEAAIWLQQPLSEDPYDPYSNLPCEVVNLPLAEVPAPKITGNVTEEDMEEILAEEDRLEFLRSRD